MPGLRKIFIQLLNEHVLAEHDHTVAFLNLGHTVYVHTFAATYQSADSNSGGKAEVFHGFLGDPAPAFTSNSATSASATVRHFTLVTSESNIIW